MWRGDSERVGKTSVSLLTEGGGSGAFASAAEVVEGILLRQMTALSNYSKHAAIRVTAYFVSPWTAMVNVPGCP